jgi:hypothetical protein
VNQAEVAISANNKIRSLPEEVPAASVAPIIGAYEAEVLEDFAIESNLDSASGFREVLANCQIIRIDDFERALDAGDFAVEALTWVKCYL